MPNAVIKSFADKARVPVGEVEKLWDETKVEALKKFKSETAAFWAYVNKTVQYKLGLVKEEVSSSKTSFRDFIKSSF